MRIKMMIENFKHHLVTSIFILICTIFISGIFIVSFEFDKFLTHFAYNEYKTNNNNYDIVIRSNTGIYIGTVNGKNDEFENSYVKKNSLYTTNLVVQANKNQIVTGVYEGNNSDLKDVFNIQNINKNEVVITKILADLLSLKENDILSLNLGTNTFDYKIVDIIDGVGLAKGNYIFLSGNMISTYYNVGISGLSNIILLDVKNKSEELIIYEYLKEAYKIHTVNYINDLEYVSTLYYMKAGTICFIMAFVILLILFMLVKIYRTKLNKQIEFFEKIGKKNYYISFQIMTWLILMILSYIVSFILTSCLFDIFCLKLKCYDKFIIDISTYLKMFVVLSIIVLLMFIRFKNINIIPKKVYFWLKHLIIIIEVIILLIFKEHVLFGLFLIILIFTLIVYIINIIYNLFKYFKNYFNKLYMYNLSKKSIISKLILVLQILIIMGISMCITMISYNNKSKNEAKSLLQIDNLIVNQYKVDTNDLFDEIKVDNNIKLYRETINNSFCFSSSQLSKYTNIKLTDAEKEKYDTDKKYVILPIAFRNKFNVKLNDKISINYIEKNKTEEFEVLKFIDTVYNEMIIVNHSNEMFYGYIFKDNTTYQNMLDLFGKNMYQIYNVSNQVEKSYDTITSIVTIVQIVLVMIIFIFIIFSIYLSYLEYKSQEESLVKLKTLGFGFEKWIKPAINKFIISIIICFVLGCIFSGIVTYYIDIILIFFGDIFHISFNLKIVILSGIISMITFISGFIVSCYQYKKI